MRRHLTTEFKYATERVHLRTHTHTQSQQISKSTSSQVCVFWFLCSCSAEQKFRMKIHDVKKRTAQNNPRANKNGLFQSCPGELPCFFLYSFVYVFGGRVFVLTVIVVLRTTVVVVFVDIHFFSLPRCETNILHKRRTRRWCTV